MRKYIREDDDSKYYHERFPGSSGSIGTPFGQGGPDFQEYINDFDGYHPKADAYIYVIGLDREHSDSLWYYVGQAKSGDLKNRLATHTRNFSYSRPHQQYGFDVLNGEGSGSTYIFMEDYRTIGVERIESIHFTNIEFNIEDLKEALPESIEEKNVENQYKYRKKQHQECYVDEQEREMAYKIAIEYSTTNVLGGK